VQSEVPLTLPKVPQIFKSLKVFRARIIYTYVLKKISRGDSDFLNGFKGRLKTHFLPLLLTPNFSHCDRTLQFIMNIFIH